MSEIKRGCPSAMELPILALAFLYFLGDLIMYTTGMPYINFAACMDHTPNTTAALCLTLDTHPELEDEIQGVGAFLQSAVHIFSTIPALLLSMFFGAWSDVNGRKFPMMLPHFGNCVSIVLFLMVDHLHGVKVTGIIMAAFLARAMCGQATLLRLMSYSYMADRLKERERTPHEEQRAWIRSMTRLQISETIGVVGGASAGWGLQVLFSPQIAFCVGSFVHVISVLLIVFVLRDTVHLPSNTTQRVPRKSFLQAFWDRLRMLCACDIPGVDRVLVWGCCLVMFFTCGLREGRAAIINVYVQHAPFSWPNSRLALFYAATSTASAVFLFFVAPCLGERTLIIISLLGSAGGGVWMGVAVTTWEMIGGGAVAHLADCTFPAVRAVLSRHVDQAQFGKVLSRLSVAEACASVIGPVAMAWIYNLTVSSYPQATFFITSSVPAVILLVGGLVIVFYRTKDQPHERQQIIAVESADESSDIRKDYTQSLVVSSTSAGSYGLFWHSAEW